MENDCSGKEFSRRGSLVVDVVEDVGKVDEASEAMGPPALPGLLLQTCWMCSQSVKSGSASVRTQVSSAMISDSVDK